MNRPADTQYPIHDLLQSRWSPRAFSTRPVETEKLASLFEAARWSPSGGNSQPWAFVVVTQDDPTHAALVATLAGFNALWAKNAPVLVLAVAKLNPDKPDNNKFAYYDVGQAIAHLSVQAGALGLHVHQMAGFDTAQARTVAAIPDGYEVLTLSAIGYFGALDDLPDALRQRETAPRTRKPLADFVFGDKWGDPLPLATPELTAAG